MNRVFSRGGRRRTNVRQIAREAPTVVHAPADATPSSQTKATGHHLIRHLSIVAFHDLPPSLDSAGFAVTTAQS
jgi:hypothetical protein